MEILGKKMKKIETPEKLDKYHYHEALDRSYLICDQFYEYVENHPVIQQNLELKNKASEILTILYNFYCQVGDVGQKAKGK